VSSIVCAVFFSYVFKRKLYFTIVFFNSFSLLYQIFNLTLKYIAPVMLGIGTDGEPWLPDWFLMVMFGFVDTITILFLTLIGPLLVAAQYRKSFEVSMGGTIISVCVGVPFVLK
jgi:hypothetical protein